MGKDLLKVKENHVTKHAHSQKITLYKYLENIAFSLHAYFEQVFTGEVVYCSTSSLMIVFEKWSFPLRITSENMQYSRVKLQNTACLLM